MSLKEKVAAVITGLPVVGDIIHSARVRELLQNRPGFRALYGGWNREHPFDRLNGTDTSGVVTTEEADIKDPGFQNFPYGGSQPEMIRKVIRLLGPMDSFTFVDLGCGKARPSLVAAEFPFRDVVGVELSVSLAEIARKNAALMARKYPERRAVRIEVADACSYRFPAGNIVLYFYNPFGEEIMAKVVANLEAAMAGESRTLYVVYGNPVYGACFDNAPAFRRFYAANVPYAREERGFGPDLDDGVVIWSAGKTADPQPGADAAIQIIRTGRKALVAVG